MKRAHSLQPLSRDHGTVLVSSHYGRKALRATVADRLRLTEQMRDFCRNEIAPNLEDEQWILSQFIGDAHLRAEFHQRHKTIRALVVQLCHVHQCEDPGLGLVSRLSNALDDYVRWEENTLFPRILDGISYDALRALTRLTSQMESGRHRTIQQLHRSVTA